MAQGISLTALRSRAAAGTRGLQTSALAAVRASRLRMPAFATACALTLSLSALAVGLLAPAAVFAATAAADPTRPFAAPQTADSPPVGGVTSLGQVTVSLAIVLAAIFAVAWLARRMRAIGRRPGALINVLAETPLGPKERVVLLQVGDKQIVVGVTANSINALHVLETPVQLPAPDSPSSPDKPNFKDLLMRSLGK